VSLMIVHINVPYSNGSRGLLRLWSNNQTIHSYLIILNATPPLKVTLSEFHCGVKNTA